MNKKINCYKCKFFKVTWNPHYPRACGAYGFKGKELPSSFIVKASGEPCKQFTPKLKEQHSIPKRSYIDQKI
ncbi:uracil-DNA glycosylase (plasmid) [Rossellomorea sp. AcN35-11]|nr:uracil-DNA glycosylase [Rossellomorea aquimaris]WJV32110.1 uracil-DNA glycosylase [Rossellomorea sp. AcN35-11]